MLYLIGLGLNENGISREGILAIEKCQRVYLENYTVDFPYELSELELSDSMIKLARGEVESEKLINEAKDEDVALLVYGSPLFATTHISLILDAEKQGVKTKVIYAASVFDAIAETGLQLYKFGKISSMPAWTEKNKPDSFIDVIKQNQSIGAHSLLLVDVGLPLKNAIEQLEKSALKKKFKLGKIVLCRKMGTKKSSIFYASSAELKKLNVKSPFCFIIPAELHFLEEDSLKRFLC